MAESFDVDTVNEQMCKVLCEELKADKTIDLYINVFKDLNEKPDGWPELDKAYTLPYKQAIAPDGSTKLNELFTAAAGASFKGFEEPYITTFNTESTAAMTAAQRKNITRIYYSPYMLWRYLTIKFGAADGAADGAAVDIRDNMTSTKIIQSLRSLADIMINEIKELKVSGPNAAGADEVGRQVTRNYTIAKYITLIRLITSIISKFLTDTRGDTTAALTLKYKNAHNVLMTLGGADFSTVEARLREPSVANLLTALGGKATTSVDEATRGLLDSGLTAARTRPANIDAARAVDLDSLIVGYNILDPAIVQVLGDIPDQPPAGVVNVTDVEDQPIFNVGLFPDIEAFLTDNNAVYKKNTKKFERAAGGGGRGSKSDSRSRKNRSRSRRR